MEESSETKTCTKCKLDQPISLFGVRSTGKLTSWCRPCKRTYDQSQNDRYREQRLRTNAAYQAANRERYREYKKSVSCTDCGISDHRVMEFDHTDDNKIDNVSALINRGWPGTLAEIAKCEPVCANCHKIRTWNRSHP